MKRVISCVLLMLVLTSNAFALEVPTDTVVQNLNGSQQAIKTFTVSPEQDPAALIEEPFELEGYLYTFADIVKSENPVEEKRIHTEVITVETTKDDLALILEQLKPTIEYDDGRFQGMTQREIRYAAIPDLRTEFHPGSEIDCIVKEYHPRTGELIVSAKETEVNPFFGAEERHPVGSRRFAMISGKYGGGVFCNLPDGVTCMCNYSYQHEDADFMVGEHVMLMVQRYDQEKLQMYGKIMSKW